MGSKQTSIMWSSVADTIICGMFSQKDQMSSLSSLPAHFIFFTLRLSNYRSLWRVNLQKLGAPHREHLVTFYHHNFVI